jgi:hypothetical protein
VEEGFWGDEAALASELLRKKGTESDRNFLYVYPVLFLFIFSGKNVLFIFILRGSLIQASLTKLILWETIAQNNPPAKLFHSTNPSVWRRREWRHTSLWPTWRAAACVAWLADMAGLLVPLSRAPHIEIVAPLP